jgi:calcineurin-like phosphoesterase family protein
MTTFFTSDVHLGHVNIISYSERPFEDVPNMNARIVEAWNEHVGPDDFVYVLGDLAMGKMDDSLPIAGQLQGHKILVPGNHDRCHPGFAGKKGVPYWEDRYHDEADIEEILGLQPRITIGHHRGVQTCHFPYSGDHTDEGDRYTALRPEDQGALLVHGHVHDAWRQNGRMFNVGMDAWGGSLLTEDELESWLDGDATLHTDRLPWPDIYPEGTP